MKLLHLLATATLACCAAAQKRVTFQFSGTQIVGYLYTPSSSSKPAPIIILTQGLGGLQTSKLQGYAEKFSSLGYNAMTFDYRFWGQSSGTPRNIINSTDQISDYDAAIDYVKTGAFPTVDPSRIVLWGTSLSGGNVLVLGAARSDLTAVICQVPHVNGPATIAQLPPLDLPSKIAAGIADAAAAALGKPRVYIPTANLTGTYGALTQAGALAGYEFVQPNPPSPGNNFPADFILAFPFFSPDTTAAQSDYPTFMAVGLKDNIVSPPASLALLASLALAKTMKNITLLTLPNAGHFDLYPGVSAYAQNLAAQVAFLQKYVPL